jgi:hypothetical protein
LNLIPDLHQNHDNDLGASMCGFNGAVVPISLTARGPMVICSAAGALPRSIILCRRSRNP